MFLPSNITLKFGDSGDFVAELQRRLARVGCFDENAVNGFFDGTTTNAVSSFQSREGLTVDGVAGPETLRRLNGVIAGDTTSASDKKDEDDPQKAVAAAIQHDILNTHTEQPYDPFLGTPAPEQRTYAEPQPAAPPEPAYAPAAPQPSQPSPAELQQRQAEQQQREAMQRQADLAAMAPPPAPAPLANTAELLAELGRQNAAQQAQATPQPAAQQPHPAELMQQQAAAAAQAQAQPEPQQPRGLAGRAMQFANAFMQKLNDYFEARLPPSVLSEVQSIGATMARAGLKEAPIPTGPELPQRAQELPQRAPEPGQQRG